MPLRDPIARQTLLVESLARRGFMSVADIAEETGVSEITIRRDLTELERSGTVRRTHGGALIARNGAASIYDIREPTFEARRRRNSDAKIRIAQAAAQFARPGHTIALDTGSTTLEITRFLADMADLRIITNNTRAASLLADSPHPVYLPGGRVRERELSIYGASAASFVAAYHYDILFLGLSGITTAGLFDYSPEDSEIKRAFIQRSDQVVALCDASKFNRQAMVRIANLSDIHALIVDTAPPEDLKSAIESAGVKIIVAPSSPG
ncbi:MAG TPA: DeoR/GlpR family DNA-binding transcription regulator [Nordella sp.]|nr:DeoR/GlpR family DNA-binding transcription regulator [Nordella sp.]